MDIIPPRFMISASIVAMAAVLCAREARAETLADVVAYAYETNPGLQAQRASMRSVDESYVQAHAGYGTNASITASESSYHEDHLTLGTRANPAPQPPANAVTDSEQISLSQPIYTGGRVRHQVEEAEANILADRQTLRRYELDLLQRIVTAYVDVLRDQSLLKISQDNVTVLDKEVADTMTRFGVREVTMTDVAEAKARLAAAESELATAQAALASSRDQFVETVGESPGDLAPPPLLDDLPDTVEDALDSAENNNPQLLNAIYAEQKSRAGIAAAEAQAFPSIGIQAQLIHSPYLPYDGSAYNNATSIGVSVTQPLFQGGQILSGIRQAKEQNNSDRLGIDDARRQVDFNIASTWEQLVAERRQLSSLEDEVKNDEFSFYGNRVEEKNALRSTIDVLNAELELSNAQKSLVQARAQEYVDRVQLLAAVGVLTTTMLSPQAQIYDASANFRRVEHKGETPLEWPAMTLDMIASPRVGPAPPASVADARPNGSVMPPTPKAQTPIRSILSTLDKPPPEPK